MQMGGTMDSECNFCGRLFSSKPAVRGHLRSCPQYQVKKRRPENFPIRELSQLQAELKAELPRAAQHRTVAVKVPPNNRYQQDRHSNASSQENLRREQLLYQQSELRRLREEEEARSRKKRETIQNIKQYVVDGHLLLHDVPVEAKAKAKLEIEQVVGRLPVWELPYYELLQIAQAELDKTYSPYLEAKKEINPFKQEESAMPKEPLFSGIYVCLDCDIEFELDRATKDELICDECSGKLIKSEDQEENFDD